MRYGKNILKGKQKTILGLFLILFPTILSGQENLKIGLHADPVISWFGSDIDAIKNDGARPGFNFGLEFTKPFGSNYSFATGISLINAGGRLVSSDITVLNLSEPRTVAPDEAMVYKIQYLAVPVGLKLRTNQIGYVTFFTDIGIEPKVVVGSKIGISSLDISGEKANEEVNLFNASYYINAGIEYGLGGNTALVVGLGFENNFLDITKDNDSQHVDKVTHRLLSFRLGINF
jgi:hypothetical protein